ncbi:MAX dimerization protein MGA a isoform X1 [Leucoraja erinacea]|uniref:MAX dimerization protein MGA a isoform X1 n=1 Tax=Leucoraja erinaceus TaxID=7782 RepID=UPI0024582502|nr:MAX dimerization protein MGA a isoform X1 [Leucoraja erinacea]XP_055496963.1 MAX dimerization protein MGA a isoform X1 [Leucoraja erinacea]
MEEQQPVHIEENNFPPNSVTPAAYFVILKQASGSNDTERSMVVAKQELGGIGCHLEKISNLVPGRTGYPVKCHSGNVCITLDNQDVWNQFFKHGTEMILTKRGRRMFPYCRFCIFGLDPLRKYILVMDIAPVDNHRYKWNGRWWEINGKADPHVLGRVYIHPNSPSSGSYWMRQSISFHKLKLTNNTLDQEGHIILHSMHRYLPRLHIIPADKLTDVIPLNGPNVHTFTFPQTEFVAVTAYQNIKITQLKIDFNPFAKGFRDDGLNSKPMRELRHQGGESMDAGCSDDSASSNSILTESSEHLSIKAGERSETEHRRICSSPDSSFDGELYNTDEEEDCLEGNNASKTNKHNAGMKFMKKRTTESILKCLPNIYSTNPTSVASSEYHEEPFKIIVKEEPPDDFEDNHVANPVILDCDGLKCKDEKEFLDSEGWDGETNCDLQNKTMTKSSTNEVATTSSAVTKQPLISPIAVTKAKMLSVESTKVPVVYLEPCTFTNGTIKISELPQKLLSSCRRKGGPIPTALQSPNSTKKPTDSSSSAENSQVENVDSKSVCSGPKESSPASEKNVNKTSTSTVSNNPTASPGTPPEKTSGEGFRFRKIKYTEKALNSGIWRTPSRIFRDSAENSPELSVCSKSARLNTKTFSSGIWRPPDGGTDSIGQTSAPHIESKSSGVSEQHATVGSYTRGRRKKLCLSAEPSQSALRSSHASSERLEREETFHDASPDLDNVEGVTFVSYASQDALQTHLVEHVSEEPSNPIHPTADPQESEEEKIERLEEQLLEDLSHLDPRVIMHPLLERAGLKPNSLMSTGNLKRLGVVISPSSASIVRPAKRDILDLSPIKQVQEPLEEVSFVSRTGKTNDFTKLKGWKQKLGQHSGSSTSKQTETSARPEYSLKNSSVFSSDKLDEYLENEEKIIEQRAALCVNKTSKVVYQMPTKSSSYVRTLDSVLKSRSSQADCRGSRTTNRTSVSPQPISVGSVSKNTKQIEMTLGPVPDSKEQKSANNAKAPSTPVKSAAKTSLRPSFAPMRPPGLSKKQMKLMNLENSARWVGKPRTYITEERAEASLVTLLTAQGSLSSKKHKVISRQAPLCKNEFCRLGCICSSLSHVKQPPKHCRKPECMFSCKCPKRKVFVLKSFSKRRKQLTKSLRDDLIFYDALADDEDWKPKAKKKKRRKVVEYAVPEPEQPVRSYPLWVREEGEVDPEPVYIAPHFESYHANRSPSLSESQSPLSPKESGSTDVQTGQSTPVSSPKLSEVPSEVDEKGPVYWYFESMMTCARVRIFERKDAERSVNCTCSLKRCCTQENSKGNNSGTVTACRLNRCRNSTTVEAMESEKLDGFENNSMSPNAAETSKWKQKEKADSLLHCDSPQEENTSLQSETPQTSVETKNTPKLIEIISDCNWESERSNILGVLAQYTANKRPLEKIRFGNFLVEIVSNYGKSRDPSPGSVLISSSVVKISQSSEKEGSGKYSGCNMSVPTTSQSPGIQLTETPPIAPKETLPTPTKCTVQEKEVTTFHLGSIVGGKQKPAFDPPTSTSRKSGMIQFTGNANGDTKLTLGQVGALHPVNWVTANHKKKIKIVEPFKMSSSTVASSASAHLPSKHPTTCSTSTGNDFLRDPNDATPVNQAKEDYTSNKYTHLVINKVGGLWKKKSSFSTLEPVLSRQQLDTPLSTVSTNVSAGISPLTTVGVMPATSGSDSVMPDTSQKSISMVAVSTGAVYTAGSRLLKSLETTDAVGSQFSGISAAKRLREESVTASTVEIPTKSTSTTHFAVISASASGVRTMPTLTKVLSPSASTITATAITNTVNTRTTIMSVASMANKTPGVSKHPETSNFTPPDFSKATNSDRPQLLMIPLKSTPTVRPAQNLQLAPGQKMILQPLKCPGAKLFQHPNGQIIQLLPLPNPGPVSRPNFHPKVTFVRNPGSGIGNRMPTPIKSCSVASSPSNVILCPKGIIPQRGRPRSIPVVKPARVALKQTFTPQSISAVVSELPVKTTSQAKFVAVNGVGQTISARHLVPLQPVGFALLQLPQGMSNAFITAGQSLKLANQSSGSQSFEKAGSEKTANQNNKSEEKLIEPELEEIHVADSELIETTVSQGVPIVDHVNADPLPEVKQATDAFPSTPSVLEADDELEDDSMDHQNAFEHPTPAELVDHSYTSEKQIVEDENENSALENSTRTGKGSGVDKDSSRFNHEVVYKEPGEIPGMDENNWLQDEQMEVEMEDSKCWFEASTFNVPLKREDDILKNPDNEELDFHQRLLRYENFLDSDKDTDSQSDLEDGDSQSDAEKIDIERMFESTSSEEAVDIETVEELSEKINIARLIASASRLTSKSKCHFHNPYVTNKSDDEEEEEGDIKSKPKHIADLDKEAQAQLDALVVYRTAHTVNERRRRSELRDLFEKLKRTLAIRGEEKASKYFILKQAFAEIQNLQDYSDCLSAGKSIQTRRRDFLIRKVSQLTGKTEEVILKKLEYICAKQRALDVEKRTSMQEGDDASEQHSVSWNTASISSMDSLQKVAMDLQIQKPPNVMMLCSGQDLMSEASRARPLILTRKHSSTPQSSTSSIPLTTGSLLMTPQGQVLTLKGPLISGQTPFFTAEGHLSENQSKGDGVSGTSIAGIASVTIQLQGLPVPLQVNNFTIAGSLSSTLTTSTQFTTRPGMEASSFGLADACQDNDARLNVAAVSVDDEVSSFMMPRIVNVTSLATGESPLLNLEEANYSCALVPQPLDFSMKGRKHTSQEQLSPMTSKKPSLPIIKSNSQSSGQFTAPDESEAMSFLVSSEATESECAQQQTQQTASSRSMNADNNAELPKALDLSGLPDGTAVSCARHSWNQDLVPGESTSVTEIILGDKLELQVMNGRLQACSMDKAGGQSDRDAELSASQLLEPLLKANGSATGDMVDTEGYEPFTSLLNELAFLNQHFSDEESPDTSMSDHHTLGFIGSGNQGDSMDELLIHGPVRLIDIDAVDSTTVLKQVEGRESGGSTSPLVLQLEGEDLNVEQLLGDEMPVNSQSELDNCTLDFEGNSTSGSNSSVNVSPPPLIHMKTTSSSTNTEIPSSLDLLWRPMPKLAPLGLAKGSGKGESSDQTESESENSPESSKPMPALARISSPQQTSTESPEVALEEH